MPTDANGCPLMYSTATQVVMNVHWDGSIALTAGMGKVYTWTKSKFVKTGDNLAVETSVCGNTLPDITTSAIAGGQKILPEIPEATWDKEGMPKIMGTGTQVGNMMNIDPGVALIGLQLADPKGEWPLAGDIMGLDQDGDMAVGITAVPRTTEGFVAPPTDITQAARTDKVYLAIRNILTLSAQVEGCPSSFGGTATVTAFDNHIIGCHVQGGAECTPAEAQFVDDNRPVFLVDNATYTSKVVPAAMTCAEVRAALPIPAAAPPPATM